MRNDISDLITFISQDDLWSGRLQEVVAEHLMPALDEFDLEYDDLPEVLGEPWPGVLWGCGFEDFLSRQYEDDNIVDLYLKRRGWNEPAANREYFGALRDTPVRLYEVSGVQPGVSMVLGDLLGDTKPVTVLEGSATQSLKQWDRIVVRVIAENDAHVISGALLAFSQEAVAFLIDGLSTVLSVDKNDELSLTTKQLLKCAPIFTNAWLFTALPRALSEELPELSNADGEDIMFHDLRFPFETGVTQKEVSLCLNEANFFAADGARCWTWLAPHSSKAPRERDGLMLESQTDGRTVLGHLELKGKALLINVNSSARADRVRNLVMNAAGQHLKQPLTTIRTVEQMMAEEQVESDLEDADEIPPEIARQIVQEHMDQHYRETLDAPIPALGGKSPNQAVRSKAGRAKVVDWLKKLENNSAKHRNDAIEEYDFGWMWAELGLQEHRK
ncbi:hypothetical protein [Falsihalocynthiibacter arcticus]|uniref:Antitoxin Xre/MbcA/ParS-like toxin-binding domain-containing protein n=1 Tax=Falsihalocynthiibacter arcticus TaxID=1579316 RepID=A0A126V0U6_9RHOB|nr:hypothetical protein [Falsihalocynthiibacter arcticus]AML51933.1 hypothetical protein RC74_12235 [Falsihalocynthiibacter arcticus]